MAYIEMFIAPVKTAQRETYQELNARIGAIHKEYGAIEIVECWGSHVPDGEVTSYPLSVKLEDDETVVTGWIRWPSKEIRDSAFEKAMQDPRMQACFENMPLDGQRMIFGGFEPILEL